LGPDCVPGNVASTRMSELEAHPLSNVHLCNRHPASHYRYLVGPASAGLILIVERVCLEMFLAGIGRTRSEAAKQSGKTRFGAKIGARPDTCAWCRQSPNKTSAGVFRGYSGSVRCVSIGPAVPREKEIRNGCAQEIFYRGLCGFARCCARCLPDRHGSRQRQQRFNAGSDHRLGYEPRIDRCGNAGRPFFQRHRALLIAIARRSSGD
jgi:hypothetical protein